MKKSMGKLKYLSAGTCWLENSYGLKCCPLAMTAYSGTGIEVYEVRVNDIFSDMDVHNPGFGNAIFESTILESLIPLQKWVNGVRTEEGMRDFSAWLQALFNEYDATADMQILIPQKMSEIYLMLQKVITEKLRGLPVYVIGYVNGNLLIASKSKISESLATSLLGGGR